MLLLPQCLMRDENSQVKKEVPLVFLRKVLNPVMPTYCLSALNPPFLALLCDTGVEFCQHFFFVSGTVFGFVSREC